MKTQQKKTFFGRHVKSSALVASLAIHALLIVIAVSFVAVSVIRKDESQFVVKKPVRPKIPLKKLQASVSKKKPKPKLRKNITANVRIDRKPPDIKIPEITGIRGGLGAMGFMGSAGDSSLGGEGLGLVMSDVKMFGIKGKGEKIFIILDASAEMMYDEMGGIPAYTIIKEEVINLLEGLSPETVFNIAVYDMARTYMLFPSLTPAQPDKVAKATQWLTPLNSVRPGMGGREYGPRTLGPGGRQENTDDLLVGKFERQELWYSSAMLAMKQQADTVFLLTSSWGRQRIAKEDWDNDWYDTSAGVRWNECYQKGLKMLDEENKERAARGQPPRVVHRDPWAINTAYFPDIERPPEPEWYYHTPQEFAEGFQIVRKQYEPKGVLATIKKRKRKIDFTFNTIHFTKKDPDERDQWLDERSEKNFRKLNSLCKGTYRSLAGLKAIKSSRTGKGSK